VISPKSLLLFLSGCAAGMLLTAVLLNPSVKAHGAVIQAGPFVDVPAGHAAARAIADLKSKGIVTGYADDTYRGAEPVTRYEFAVVLARFAKYYDRSTRPLASSPAPMTNAPSWASPSRQYLAANSFVPASSAVFASPGNATVTADQLADSLSSTFDRIIDRSMPPAQQ